MATERRKQRRARRVSLVLSIFLSRRVDLETERTLRNYSPQHRRIKHNLTKNLLGFLDLEHPHRPRGRKREEGRRGERVGMEVVGLKKEVRRSGWVEVLGLHLS